MSGFMNPGTNGWQFPEEQEALSKAVASSATSGQGGEKKKGEGWGPKLKRFAELLAMAQHGDEIRAYQAAKRKEAMEMEELGFRRDQNARAGTSEQRAITKAQQDAEVAKYNLDRGRVVDTREDTTFEQGQEDRTRTEAERAQGKKRAQEYARKNYPGMNVDFIESMDDLKAVISADQVRAQTEANKALGGLRRTQADAGGYRPQSGQVPKWTNTDQKRMTDTKLKLRQAVANGDLSQEEAQEEWSAYEEQALAQKRAAQEYEQRALVTGGGRVRVDGSGLTGQGEVDEEQDFFNQVFPEKARR